MTKQPLAEYHKLSMSKNAIIGAVVVVAVILASWYFIKSSQKTAAPPVPTEITATPSPNESPTPATEGATIKEEKNPVTITQSGFSPKDITIPAGETVSWMNSDTADHAVNSASHPTHTVYPPLNLDTIKPGEKKSLTFPNIGTYKYHDHLNPSLTGSVTVQ